jgi:hypothetical protein
MTELTATALWRTTGLARFGGLNVMERIASYCAALTPLQRWQAARRLPAGFGLDRWLVLVALAALGLSLAIVAIVAYGRYRSYRASIHKSFQDAADRCGLSGQQRQLLLAIVRKAGLKREDAVFTAPAAFERGANLLLRQLSLQTGMPDQAEQLAADIATLRTRLGFVRAEHFWAAAARRADSRSSQAIPEGVTVRISRLGRESDQFDAEVIGNNERYLTVRPSRLLTGRTEGLWRVQCNLGGAVWEFDTAILRKDGENLLLSHSDEIRYLNRRRFARVAIGGSAYVAAFPFRTASADEELQVPEFVPARLTELAGPGLRLDSDVQLPVGERVLVVLQLPDNRTVQDMGQVRRTIKTAGQGFSSAIELMGLDERGLSELVRATNTAAIKSRAGLSPALVGAADIGSLESAQRK